MSKLQSGPYEPLTASGDHNGKEGYAVTAAGAVSSSATAEHYGVIVTADDPAGTSTIALPQCQDKIQVRLHTTAGSIVKGSRLQLHTNGTWKLDAGAGARVVGAIAAEAKAAEGQLLAARLIPPVVYGS
jgi:hypothetical protein